MTARAASSAPLCISPSAGPSGVVRWSLEALLTGIMSAGAKAEQMRPKLVHRQLPFRAAAARATFCELFAVPSYAFEASAASVRQRTKGHLLSAARAALADTARAHGQTNDAGVQGLADAGEDGGRRGDSDDLGFDGGAFGTGQRRRELARADALLWRGSPHAARLLVSMLTHAGRHALMHTCRRFRDTVASHAHTLRLVVPFVHRGVLRAGNVHVPGATGATGETKPVELARSHSAGSSVLRAAGARSPAAATPSQFSNGFRGTSSDVDEVERSITESLSRALRRYVQTRCLIVQTWAHRPGEPRPSADEGAATVMMLVRALAAATGNVLPAPYHADWEAETKARTPLEGHRRRKLKLGGRSHLSALRSRLSAAGTDTSQRDGEDDFVSDSDSDVDPDLAWAVSTGSHKTLKDGRPASAVAGLLRQKSRRTHSGLGRVERVKDRERTFDVPISELRSARKSSGAVPDSPAHGVGTARTRAADAAVKFASGVKDREWQQPRGPRLESLDFSGVRIATDSFTANDQTPASEQHDEAAFASDPPRSPASPLSRTASSPAFRSPTIASPMKRALRLSTAAANVRRRIPAPGGFVRQLLLMQCCRGLRWLSFARCGIDSDNMRHLSQALGADGCTPHLTTLVLTGNAFGASGAAALGQALRSLPLLQRLLVGSNPLGDDGMVQLAEGIADTVAAALRQHRDAESHADIAGAGGVEQRRLARIPLRALDVSRCQFGERGAKSIGTALASLPGLTALDASHNDLRDAGCIQLLKSVSSSRKLKSLSLTSTGIGYPAVAVLCNILVCGDASGDLAARAAKVRALSEREGGVDVAGGQQLAAMPPKVSEVSSSSSAGQQNAELLSTFAKEAALAGDHYKHFPDLVQLRLDQNNSIYAAGAFALACALPCCPKLTHFTIAGTDVGGAPGRMHLTPALLLVPLALLDAGESDAAQFDGDGHRAEGAKRGGSNVTREQGERGDAAKRAAASAADAAPIVATSIAAPAEKATRVTAESRSATPVAGSVSPCALLDTVSMLTDLVSLCLRGAMLTQLSGCRLWRALPRCRRLQRLDLSGNDQLFGPAVIPASTSYERRRRQEHADARHAWLADKFIAALTRCLKLQMLDLSDCGVPALLVTSLAHALTEPPLSRMKDLRLNDNPDIGWRGGAALASTLRACELQSMEVAGCRLLDKGCVALVAALLPPPFDAERLKVFDIAEHEVVFSEPPRGREWRGTSLERLCVGRNFVSTLLAREWSFVLHMCGHRRSNDPALRRRAQRQLDSLSDPLGLVPASGTAAVSASSAVAAAARPARPGAARSAASRRAAEAAERASRRAGRSSLEERVTHDRRVEALRGRANEQVDHGSDGDPFSDVVSETLTEVEEINNPYTHRATPSSAVANVVRRLRARKAAGLPPRGERRGDISVGSGPAATAAAWRAAGFQDVPTNLRAADPLVRLHVAALATDWHTNLVHLDLSGDNFGSEGLVSMVESVCAVPCERTHGPGATRRTQERLRRQRGQTPVDELRQGDTAGALALAFANNDAGVSAASASWALSIASPTAASLSTDAGNVSDDDGADETADDPSLVDVERAIVLAADNTRRRLPPVPTLFLEVEPEFVDDRPPVWLNCAGSFAGSYESRVAAVVREMAPTRRALLVQYSNRAGMRPVVVGTHRAWHRTAAAAQLWARHAADETEVSFADLFPTQDRVALLKQRSPEYLCSVPLHDVEDAVSLVGEAAIVDEQQARDRLATLALLWSSEHAPECAQLGSEAEWMRAVNARHKVYFSGIEPEGSYDEWPMNELQFTGSQGPDASPMGSHSAEM